MLALLVHGLQVLQLYKDYIDPEFTWSNFSLEEQAKVIVAPRSNNLLETKRVGWAVCTLRQEYYSAGNWRQVLREGWEEVLRIAGCY